MANFNHELGLVRWESALTMHSQCPCCGHWSCGLPWGFLDVLLNLAVIA